MLCFISLHHNPLVSILLLSNSSVLQTHVRNVRLVRIQLPTVQHVCQSIMVPVALHVEIVIMVIVMMAYRAQVSVRVTVATHRILIARSVWRDIGVSHVLLARVVMAMESVVMERKETVPVCVRKDTIRRDDVEIVWVVVGERNVRANVQERMQTVSMKRESKR